MRTGEAGVEYRVAGFGFRPEQTTAGGKMHAIAPAIFVSHGAPTMYLHPTPTHEFLVALGKALDKATRIDERTSGELPSTKEWLES